MNAMLATAARPAAPVAGLPRTTPDEASQAFARRITSTLAMVSERVALQRRIVHEGDRVYAAGEASGELFVINSGCFKVVTLSPDGREQVVALKFRGDWLGADDLGHTCYSCDAIAMDTGEVWAVRYVDLIDAARQEPALLTVLHQAMSREIARERDSLMSVCTLSGDARVANFLRDWAESLARRGLRTDRITLRMTRAEIGNYLGMTLESVSRGLSRLARARLIGFAGKGRREVCIPDVAALSAFVQGTLAAPATLQ